MTPFMTEDFLLDTEFARRLYHDYAKDQPIFDYHCHLPPQQIAEDYRFKNLYDIWLKGDHYKWRAMRTNGVAERLCTGDASDREKFDAWAATVPHTIGNPLYHWTHLELRRPFGITGKLLSPSTADEIWNECNELLAQDNFSARGIMQQMNVKMVGTTDDPIDSLEHHAEIAKDGSFTIKVVNLAAMERSFAGNHSELAFRPAGIIAASAAPTAPRATARPPQLPASAVAPQNTAHSTANIA